MMNRAKNKGFTLIEIAISLLIIGFILAGVLGPLSTQIEQKDRQGTQAQLDDIREALLGFAITHGRLPCPDINNDGEEDRLKEYVSSEEYLYCQADLRPTSSNYFSNSGANSYISIGNLPFVTLGIPEFDAWKEHFTYAITSDFADDYSGANNEAADNRPDHCGTATVGVSFELCSGGNLDIIDSVGGNPVVNNIPAIVFSTGKHGTSVSGDQSADEQENTDGDGTFVFHDYSQADGAEFDDLMIWISPNILKNRMVQAGRLP